MRRFALLPLLVFVTSTLTFSSTCTTGTLESYIGLGSGGCTVGDTTIYNFQTVPGLNGATEIATNLVAVSPIGAPSNPGISVLINASSSAGNVFESIFTYQVSGGPYINDTITLSGASESGDGAVTDTQNICESGTFEPDGISGCSGTANALVTLDGFQNTASQTLTSDSNLSVTDDFVVDGGTFGTATAGTITDQFAVVPEPSTVLLMGSGIGVAAAFRRRAKKAEARVTRSKYEEQ